MRLTEVIGIGVDIVEMARIARYAQRDTFANRVYTSTERSMCVQSAFPGHRHAEIFACKEAFLKALGLGIGGGVSLQEIEIRYTQDGLPALHPSGQAQAALQSLGVRAAHLDTARSRILIVAIVVLAR